MRLEIKPSVTQITQELVRRPSFVNVTDKQGNPLPAEKRTDERLVNNYIVDFLKTNAPDIAVVVQDIGDGRSNIIAKRGEDPKLLLLGHTDTVFPSLGGQYDPLSGEIVDAKLYGLGATDMKGGVACALSAMSLAPQDVPLAAIFYADEEFNFEGMKALIKNELPNIKPELLMSLDGSDMQLGTACRGIMQLRATIRGTSAHAGRPQMGVDAISGAESAIAAVRELLKEYTTDMLGSTSLNRATMNGGKEFINESGESTIVEQGNAVPDIAQFVLDIRTSSPDVTPEIIRKRIADFCQENNLRFDPEKDITVDFAYGAWMTDKTDPQVQEVATIMEEVTKQPAVFTDPRGKGYIDMQMLWETLGKPPAVMTGPGIGALAHKPDEYVEVEKLQECRDVVLEVIQRYGRRSKPTESVVK